MLEPSSGIWAVKIPAFSSWSSAAAWLDEDATKRAMAMAARMMVVPM